MTPFLRIPFVIPGASALVLDATKVSPMFTAPATAAPGQVIGLTAGVAGSTSQALSWTAPLSGGAPTDYLVERRANSSGAWSGALIGSATPATVVSGLTPAVTYQWRVTAVNLIGAGVVSASITAATNNPYEAGAVGHWLLGGDVSSLTGKGGVMTPLSTAPTYSAGYLTMPAGTTLQNGLASPFTDAVEQTLCGVFQYEAAGNQLLLGYIATSGASTGEAFFRNSTGFAVNTKPGGLGTTVAKPNLVQGQWYFAAIAHTATGNGRRVFIGGNASSVADTVAKTAAVGKVGIGNTGFTPLTQFPDAVSCAEFIVFSSALDDDGMKAVYLRTKARMSERGITVF